MSIEKRKLDMAKQSSPKRLPNYAGLRLPRDAAYCELIGMLTDSRQRLEEGAEELAEAGYCTRAIIAFIMRDPIASQAVLPGPLNTLAAAIHDLEQGSSPALFAKSNSVGGKRTNLVSRDLIKAWIATAYDGLLESHINAHEAGTWVAQECQRLGISQTEGPITPSRVKRWWTKLRSEQIAASQAIELFKRLRSRNKAIRDPWDRARLTLETYSRVMMEPKRRDNPPFSGKRRAATS